MGAPAKRRTGANTRGALPRSGCIKISRSVRENRPLSAKPHAHGSNPARSRLYQNGCPWARRDFRPTGLSALAPIGLASEATLHGWRSRRYD